MQTCVLSLRSARPSNQASAAADTKATISGDAPKRSAGHDHERQPIEDHAAGRKHLAALRAMVSDRIHQDWVVLWSPPSHEDPRVLSMLRHLGAETVQAMAMFLFQMLSSSRLAVAMRILPGCGPGWGWWLGGDMQKPAKISRSKEDIAVGQNQWDPILGKVHLQEGWDQKSVSPTCL